MPEWKILWRETIQQTNTHSHHCSASLTFHLGAAEAIDGSALLTSYELILWYCCWPHWVRGTCMLLVFYSRPRVFIYFFWKAIQPDVWFRIVVPTNCSCLLTSHMPDEATTYALFCFTHKQWTEENVVLFIFVPFVLKVMLLLNWDSIEINFC